MSEGQMIVTKKKEQRSMCMHKWCFMSTYQSLSALASFSCDTSGAGNTLVSVQESM